MIQARAKIPNMAPPTLSRMIRVADLEAGGYGSLEGTKVVVYIVVIVVASDMFFFFPGKWAGDNAVGEGALGEAQEGNLGEFYQRVHLSPPSLPFCLLLGGDELTKSKNTFRKIDISALRFSLASNFFPIANNIFSFFGRFS